MGDLLGGDYGLVEKNVLYRMLDKLPALFSHLQLRWRDLFGAKFEVLLYDLTSTHFESAPPENESDKRRFGYSRDQQRDCVQVVIALIVTPEGFPIAYEVLPGNTSDKATLKTFLERIEKQYGKAERIWVMDRGIPTEAVLAEMRQSDPPIYYLVGTPKGPIEPDRSAIAPTGLAGGAARRGGQTPIQRQGTLPPARSRDRVHKERAMRQRQIRALCQRLAKLRQMTLTPRQLLLKLGDARGRYRAAWRLLEMQLPAAGSVGPASFFFRLNRAKLRAVRRREGRYLLRTNLVGLDPAQLWQFYIQLIEIETAFKNLKDGPAPHLPSIGTASRSAHLRGVHRLLFARHHARPIAPVGRRTDPARSAG